MRRKWNILVWSGFAIVLLALVSYIPFFALFPITRNVPWANILLFLAGGGVLAVGLKRAFRQPELYRGKVAGTILGVLTLALFGFFCVGVFYFTRQIPSAAGALHAGQPAPDFTLSDANGKQVALADLLKNNRAVVLIFYRGYW